MKTVVVALTAHGGPRLPVPESVIARGIVARPPSLPRSGDVSAIIGKSRSRPVDPSSLFAHAANPVQPVAPNAAAKAIEPIASTDPRSPRVIRRKARSAEAKLMRRIESAVARGDTKTAKHLREAYTRSRAAKIVAMLDTARERHQRRQSAPAGVQAIVAAEALNVRRAPAEPVTVFRKAKSRGRTRVIHAFGPLHAARQKLVCRAMKPFLTVDPRQYATSNGGRPAACRAVLDHMRTAKWAVEVDIADFFPSADKGWLLRHLPLDARASSSTLLLEDAEKDCQVSQRQYEIGYDGPVSLLADARFGLPQGASTSALAAERIVADIMGSIPRGLPIVNFADNFLILASTRAELERSLETLRTAIERCPAGRLSLTVKKTRRLVAGVDFLGYRFQSRRSGPFVTPSPKNVTALRRRVAKLLSHVHHEGRRNSRTKLKQFITSWRAAFDLSAGLTFFTFTVLRDMFMPILGGQRLRAEVIGVVPLLT